VTAGNGRPVAAPLRAGLIKKKATVNGWLRVDGGVDARKRSVA
jgi:hypothetical protein